MPRKTSWLMLLGICVASVAMADDPQAKPVDAELAAIQGLWEGSWGGGNRNGVIFQPVIAKLAIHGNRVEWWGLPQTGDGLGTIRLSRDDKSKTLRLTAAVKPGDASPGEVTQFSYAVKEDSLTLAVGEARECSFSRVAVSSPPRASVAVELVIAEGINDSGNLQIMRTRSRHVASLNAEYFEPERLNYSINDASIFRLEKRELKKLTVDQVRPLLQKPTPVALSFRHSRELPLQRPDERTRHLGAAQPDSEPGLAMLKSLLADGTLVFVLPPEQVPAS